MTQTTRTWLALGVLATGVLAAFVLGHQLSKRFEQERRVRCAGLLNLAPTARDSLSMLSAHWACRDWTP